MSILLKYREAVLALIIALMVVGIPLIVGAGTALPLGMIATVEMSDPLGPRRLLRSRRGIDISGVVVIECTGVLCVVDDALGCVLAPMGFGTSVDVDIARARSTMRSTSSADIGARWGTDANCGTCSAVVFCFTTCCCICITTSPCKSCMALMLRIFSVSMLSAVNTSLWSLVDSTATACCT